MKCKIITGTRLNCEEQMNKLLEVTKTIISIDTSPSQTNGIIITVVYMPRTIQQTTKSDTTQL